jgi:glucosamine--fructose-6-phosphate aminotransferase (isomerizing)
MSLPFWQAVILIHSGVDFMNPMLAQVFSIPGLIRDIFQPFDASVRTALDHRLCLSVKRLYITGCGDSHHAAVAARMAFEFLAGVPTEALTALQFARYTAPFLPQTEPGTNVAMAISVSGEVARTIEALQQARLYGATTVALTSTPGSRLFQAGDIVINSQTPNFPDPPQVHVPGVRSYTANLFALLLAAIRIGEVRRHTSSPQASAYRQEILDMAGLIQETIEACVTPARALAEKWADLKEFVYVGSGPNYASALFSAAKILEASGAEAMAQDTEEWAHLQYFARKTQTPTFLISCGGRDNSRLAEVAEAARTIARPFAVIAPPSQTALLEKAEQILPLPGKMAEMFSPLVACIPGEMFAAYLAEVVGEPYFRAFGGGRSMEGGGGISRIRTSEMLDPLQK